MADNNKSETKVEPEVDTKAQQGDDEPKQSKSDDSPSKETAGILAELKSERKKRQEFESKLSDYEKQQEEARQKKLEEEGKLKELLEERDKKLKELEPDANAFRDYRTSRIETAKEKLGDKWKDSYSSLPLQDVEDLINLVSEPVKLSVDRSTSTKHGSNEIPKNFNEWQNKFLKR